MILILLILLKFYSSVVVFLLSFFVLLLALLCGLTILLTHVDILLCTIRPTCWTLHCLSENKSKTMTMNRIAS